MKYDPDDFLALIDQIQSEGGFLQTDKCNGVSYSLTVDSKPMRFKTAACSEQARFAIFYDQTVAVDLECERSNPRKPEDGFVKISIKHGGERDDGPHYAAVCANDDSIGLWPRFAHLMSEGSSEG